MGKISVNLKTWVHYIDPQAPYIEFPFVRNLVCCKCKKPADGFVFHVKLSDNLKDINYKVDFYCKDCYIEK